MATTNDYQVGSIIEYQNFGGKTVRVRVIDRDPDVKDGRPGFDGEVTGGPDKGVTVWGYDEQVTRVIA